MKARLIHDYGELKILSMLRSWRSLKNDRDVCWTFSGQMDEVKEIFDEFMSEDYKEKQETSQLNSKENLK